MRILIGVLLVVLSVFVIASRLIAREVPLTVAAPLGAHVLFPKLSLCQLATGARYIAKVSTSASDGGGCAIDAVEVLKGGALRHFRWGGLCPRSAYVFLWTVGEGTVPVMNQGVFVEVAPGVFSRDPHSDAGIRWLLTESDLRKQVTMTRYFTTFADCGGPLETIGADAGWYDGGRL